MFTEFLHSVRVSYKTRAFLPLRGSHLLREIFMEQWTSYFVWNVSKLLFAKKMKPIKEVYFFLCDKFIAKMSRELLKEISFELVRIFKFHFLTILLKTKGISVEQCHYSIISTWLFTTFLLSFLNCWTDVSNSIMKNQSNVLGQRKLLKQYW